MMRSSKQASSRYRALEKLFHTFGYDLRRAYGGGNGSGTIE